MPGGTVSGTVRTCTQDPQTLTWGPWQSQTPVCRRRDRLGDGADLFTCKAAADPQAALPQCVSLQPRGVRAVPRVVTQPREDTGGPRAALRLGFPVCAHSPSPGRGTSPRAHGLVSGPGRPRPGMQPPLTSFLPGAAA